MLQRLTIFLSGFPNSSISDCDPNKFYIYENFSNHLRSSAVHIDAAYTCPFCSIKIHSTSNHDLVKIHLRCHGMTELQCLHCAFGVIDVEKMKMHMAEHHPDKGNIAVSRANSRASELTPAQQSDINSTSFMRLSPAYDRDAFDFLICRFSNEKLNYMNPKLIAVDENLETPPEDSHPLVLLRRVLDSCNFRNLLNNP